MRILIDIGHPAHVHVFKHYAREMEKRGAKVLFTAKEKECTVDLLEAYQMDYILLGKPFTGAIKKVYGLWHFGRKLFKISKTFRPDVFLSISSMYAAHASSLMNKPHLVLDDTEHSSFEHLLYGPFSRHILTPACFEKHMGKKQIRYDGYHELAYLHPFRFTPDATIEQYFKSNSKKNVLLRFVSWNAGHDIKANGMNLSFKRELIQRLSQSANVLISSEKKLPEDLEALRVSFPAEMMHSVLYHIDLYIGEGASMASECAMLGTPSIYVNTLNAGTLKEQEAFGLIHGFRSCDGVIEMADTILSDPESKSKYSERTGRMLSEKVDVTHMLCNLTEELVDNGVVETRLITKRRYAI